MAMPTCFANGSTDEWAPRETRRMYDPAGHELEGGPGRRPDGVNLSTEAIGATMELELEWSDVFGIDVSPAVCTSGFT